MNRTAKKQSTSKLSALAAKVLANPKSGRDAKRLAGSVLTQDETPGQAGRARVSLASKVELLAMFHTWSRSYKLSPREQWRQVFAVSKKTRREHARAFLRALGKAG
jgi:hypothetical protein